MQIFRLMPAPPVKTILSLQSEVVFGHVGNSAARFALQRMGHDVLGLPTVLFSNHPGHGGFRGRATPVEELRALLDGLEERGLLAQVDAVLSGYLGEAAQADLVREAVLRVKRLRPAAPYLLDPVFGDEGGAYARPGVAEAMAKHLLPLADIVTPNRFELASLTSRRIEGPADAVSAARMLGRPLVLVTSVPAGDAIATMAVTPAAAWSVATPRVPDPPNGIGDLLAALFLGHRLGGQNVPQALGRSASALDRLIAASRGAKDVRLVANQDMLADGQSLPARPFPDGPSAD